MFRKRFLVSAISLVACSWVYLIPAQTPAPVSDEEYDLNRPSSVGQQTNRRPSAELCLRPAVNTNTQAIPSTVAAARNVRLDSEVPSLRVSTTGPDTIVVGKPATYVIAIANQGKVTARQITVQIPLPSWVDLQATETTTGTTHQGNRSIGDGQLVWNVDRVLAHAEETLSLVLVPKEGRGFDLTVDWSVRQTSSTTQISVKEPKLQLELAGPADFVFGETAAWTIALTNPGTGDAHDVSLDVYSNVNKLGSLVIGTIKAGAERIVDLKLRPTAAGVGQLRAVAVAEPGLEADGTRAFLVRRGELHVKLQGPIFEYAGIKAVYQVRVSNTGNADAEDVAVSLSLPEDAKYVDGLEAAEVVPSGVSWKIECVNPGKESVFQIACELCRGGDQEFAVKASAPHALVATDSVVTRVQSVADLKLEVVDPKGPRPVGEQVQYEIHVTNRGTAPARQIHIVAICSPEVEPIDVTGNAAVESGQIFFRPIAELEPGRTIVHKVTVRAQQAGGHQFRVIVQSDDPDTRLVSEETTRFFVRPATLQNVTIPQP